MANIAHLLTMRFLDIEKIRIILSGYSGYWLPHTIPSFVPAQLFSADMYLKDVQEESGTGESVLVH